jgi:predicted nuclease of predicted toxin-antitoxin system
MKLLLDQNLSYRLAKTLNSLPFKIAHVSEVGLSETSDMKIWTYAKENNFCIVTFDADFNDIQTIKSFPPKIIWLRFGNLTRREAENFFRENAALIHSFLTSDEFSEVGSLVFRYY